MRGCWQLLWSWAGQCPKPGYGSFIPSGSRIQQARPCPNGSCQIRQRPCGGLCSRVSSLLPSLPSPSSFPIPRSSPPGHDIALPHHAALPSGTPRPHGAQGRQAGRAGNNGQQEDHSFPHMCCPPCRHLYEAKLMLAGDVPPSSLPLS